MKSVIHGVIESSWNNTGRGVSIMPEINNYFKIANIAV